MATMRDPAVRWAILRTGHDMSEVQKLVTDASDDRKTRTEDSVPITPEAVEVLSGVLADVPELDPLRGPVVPVDRSRGLSRLLARLFVAADGTAAIAALTQLGLTAERAPTLLAEIEARAGRGDGPSPAKWY